MYVYMCIPVVTNSTFPVSNPTLNPNSSPNPKSIPTFQEGLEIDISEPGSYEISGSGVVTRL